MPHIRLEGITVRYGSVTALDHISFHVRNGETMAVVGPSGCGKTTLLKTIAGLIEPDAGHVYFNERDVTDLRPAERGIGMLFQDFALFPHFDSRSNIAFPLKIRNQPDIDKRVQETAQRLGIDRKYLLERSPTTLSAGEQQLVALGRALISDPAVLLMDEPMSKLDAQTRLRTRAQLGRLMELFHTTALYVTHDEQEARALADRMAVMREGRILQVGTPGELYRRPAHVFVAQFVGSPAMNILPARIEGEHLWIDGAKQPLPLPPLRTRLADGPILVGFRPEHLQIEAEGPLSIAATQVEPLLAQRVKVIYGEMEEEPLIAQVPATTTVRPGNTLELTIAPEDLHLFDPRDHTRIP
ncbi:MAG: ABC transporter ATP-binding protein [Chloroflexota bacterium]|nr:ABC transporter ATP-binding protein [Chloroflexota bacterium]